MHVCEIKRLDTNLYALPASVAIVIGPQMMTRTVTLACVCDCLWYPGVLPDFSLGHDQKGHQRSDRVLAIIGTKENEIC
jgi:hypothetical protein